ncbi:MAG: ParB/RepB/Spo0J family partition protein [Candidatus Hermodarchaeia archaeon]|jgi:ParB/RepB/Spo0J family partition protein
MEAIQNIAIDKIEPNPNQPRKHFDDNSLNELADSIKAKGLLEPIVVRPFDGRYQIVCGERRWRACKIAGIDTIQSIVRECTDDESFEISLSENVQRDNLNPIDEALAYKSMIDKGYTQQQIADTVHKGRSYIAQKLRLLDLPDDVREFVSRDTLTEGHARQLLRLKGIFQTYSRHPERWHKAAYMVASLVSHGKESVAVAHHYVDTFRWNFFCYVRMGITNPRTHVDWQTAKWAPKSREDIPDKQMRKESNWFFSEMDRQGMLDF